MQVSRNVVVASIQVDLDDDVLDRFRQDLLERVHQTGSRAVFLDVSALETLDPDEFAALRRIISMVSIMGSGSVIVGLQPGVVSALVEVNADVEGLQTAIDLDAAFELLEPAADPEPDPEPDPEAEAEPETDGEVGNEELLASVAEPEDFLAVDAERRTEGEP